MDFFFCVPILILFQVNLTNYDSADDGFEDLDDNQIYEEELTYKIGDLGHVTSLSNPQVRSSF